MTKVCRLCLMRLQRGSKYFNINAVESFTGFMPYRDQLTTCIPEMALDLIPNPVICNNCRTALKSAYDFKSRCLFVEKKIQQYIESQNFNENNQINYDLSQIPTDDVPPLNKLALLIPKSDPEHEDITISPEKFLKIQSDELPHNMDSPEQESENSNSNTPIKDERDMESCSSATNPADYLKRLQKPHRNHRGIYPRSRMSVPRLYNEDEFVCNFCHEPFRSLQLLRKHNNICSKSTQNDATKNILTKRPHLPTKAKNHLKKWLFRHTDHPYPTDQEKQMLMKETNLSLLQVENWFINARRRILQDLTKLKSRGFRSEDIYDSSLGLEMDFEELVPQNTINTSNSSLDPLEDTIKITEVTTVPIDPLEDPTGEPLEDPIKVPEVARPPENLKQECDIKEEQVDLAKVKSEIEDNR